MLKVSKILIASNWLHIWMDPKGATHDAGNNHADWAWDYIENTNLDTKGEVTAYNIMFANGWTRLGNYCGDCYVHGFALSDRARFAKIQMWVMGQNAKNVSVDLDNPRIHYNYSSEEFLAAKSISDLASMFRRLVNASADDHDHLLEEPTIGKNPDNPHFWMEPDGIIHDAGYHHGRWAFKYLGLKMSGNSTYEEAYNTLFSRGWVRLGGSSNSSFIEAKAISSRELFGKVQTWVEARGKNTVYVDTQSPKISDSFTLKEFVTAGSTIDLRKMCSYLVKASRILKASWVHVWMDPDGKLYNAGENHCDWAASYNYNRGVKSDRNNVTLISEGWVRLGHYSDRCYVQADNILEGPKFSRIKSWIAKEKPLEVIVETTVPRIQTTISLDEFLGAESPKDLYYMSRAAV